MRRRNNNPQKQQSFYPATAEQLAHLQSLQASVKSAVKHWNRLFASAGCVIVIPTLVKILFLKEYSPLHCIYQEYQRYLYQKQATLVDPIFIERIKHKLVGINNQRLNIDNILQSFGILEKVNDDEFIIQDLDDYDEKVNVDELILRNFAYYDEEVLNSEIRQLYIFMKKTIIKLYIDARGKGPMHIDDRELPFLNEDDAAKYGLSDLYTQMDLAIQMNKIKLSHLFNQALPLAYQENAIEEVNKLLVFAQVLMTVFANYFVIEPLVTKIFPSGVFQESLPKVNTSEWLGKENARDIISLLSAHQTNLKEKTKPFTRTARYLWPGLFLVSLYYIMTGELSAEIFSLCVVLMGTALTNVQEDLAEWKEKRQLRAAIDSQYEHLSIALSFLNGDVKNKKALNLPVINLQPIEEELFAASYISLHINKPYELLPIKALIKIIKTCFFYFNIPITAASNNAIYIPINDKLNEQSAKDLQKMLKDSIQHVINIKLLKRQVQKLLDTIGVKEKSIYRPYPDVATGLPLCTIQFTVKNDSLGKLLINKVEELFGQKNKYTVKNNGNYSDIIIEGFLAAEEYNFSNTSDELKKLYHHIISQASTENYKPSFFSRVQDNSDKTIKSKEDINNNNTNTSQGNEPEIKEETAPARVARWRTGIYDSEASTNTISPIIFGKVHDKKALSITKHFLRNGLNPASFPNDRLYRVLCDIIAAPHLGDNFVFASGSEKNQQGADMIVSGKLRPGGHTEGVGNMRAFTTIVEINEEGDVLHEAVGVDFTWHPTKKNN